VLANLKLRQLRLLVALDTEHQLQLAAEALNISQSAASKMLAEIEAIAGVPLFKRTARGVEATPYGLILVRGGKGVLANLDVAIDELNSYMSGGSGSVTIGTIVAPCLDLIVDVWQYHGRKLEKINVTLDVATSPPLVEGLLSHRYDFIAARIPSNVDSRQFDYVEIAEEEAIGLLVRTEHPLADRDVVDLTEMVDLQWICQPPGAFLRQSVERLFFSHGIALPKRIIDTESFLASVAIASRLDAIVPFPEMFFGIVDPQRFKMLRLKKNISLQGYGLVKVKGYPLSPAANVLFDAMKSFTKAHAGLSQLQDG